jgi:hypothetical protein
MDANRKRGPKQVNLLEVESFLSTARSDAEALLQVVRSLPEVDAQGKSDCPFAEEMYAKKNESEKKVCGDLDILRQHQADVKRLMDACKNDLIVVAAREDQLNSDSARAHFTEAEVKLAALYRRCRKLLVRIKLTIEFVQQALAEASAKQIPGGSEQDGDGSRIHDSGSGKASPSNPSAWGADKELEDLFELDRQRQSEE